MADDVVQEFRRDVLAARTGPRHRQEQPLPRIADGDVARWDGIEPPDIEFVIADLAPRGMVTLMPGNGGVGKTLVMQIAATSVVANVPFLGRSIMPGAAAGIFAEDPASVLHLRQHRINRHFGIEYARLSGRLFAQSYFGHDVRLWRDGQPTKAFAEIEEQLAAIDDLRMVMLDNAALLYGGEESDRGEVTAFMSALNGLAARLGAAVLLSHHGSKSQDGTALRAASGSTAWINASRSVVELKPAEDDAPPRLKVIKANHAATGTEIALEWRDKLLVARDQPTGIFGTIERRSVETIFLENLRRLAAGGTLLRASKHAENYAPKVIAKLQEADGRKWQELENAMWRLISENRIRRVETGPPSKRREHIEPVPEDAKE